MKEPRFIEHGGRHILHADYSRCTPAEHERLMAAVSEQVAREPSGSVLLLVDLTGAELTTRSELLTLYVRRDAPHIAAVAVVGARGLKRRLLEDVKALAGHPVVAFDDLEDARDWLVTQGTPAGTGHSAPSGR